RRSGRYMRPGQAGFSARWSSVGSWLATVRGVGASCDSIDIDFDLFESRFRRQIAAAVQGDPAAHGANVLPKPDDLFEARLYLLLERLDDLALSGTEVIRLSFTHLSHLTRLEVSARTWRIDTHLGRRDSRRNGVNKPPSRSSPART